ncbi:MAG: hypothetical protein EOM80_05785 [Erysipelotrichia bacterium]|nr:hypothetical protein [Erysipelotrichia bacterium]
MNEIKKKLRSCETDILKAGILLALLLIAISLNTGCFYHSILAGYYISSIIFAISMERLTSSDSHSGLPSKVTTLLFGNIKLLLIAFIVFILHKYGFSVKETVTGILLSQLMIILSFITTLYSDLKSAEEYKNKAKHARS